MTLRSARSPGFTAPRSPNPYSDAVSLVILRTTHSSGSRSWSRSRAQCVSMNVGVEASHVVPQCAPPSPSPHALVGCRSISRTASRFVSEKLRSGRMMSALPSSSSRRS